jgi:hypothetical protein
MSKTFKNLSSERNNKKTTNKKITKTKRENNKNYKNYYSEND